MNYAVMRMTELRLAGYSGVIDRLPDTYPEFLLLTSTAGRREPSAEQRARGCTVQLRGPAIPHRAYGTIGLP